MGLRMTQLLLLWFHDKVINGISCSRLGTKIRELFRMHTNAQVLPITQKRLILHSFACRDYLLTSLDQKSILFSNIISNPRTGSILRKISLLGNSNIILSRGSVPSQSALVFSKNDYKEHWSPLNLPQHIVHTHYALWLRILSVVYNSCLSFNPDIATLFGQHSVLSCCHLSFCEH